jgi:hypothetical protein
MVKFSRISAEQKVGRWNNLRAYVHSCVGSLVLGIILNLRISYTFMENSVETSVLFWAGFMYWQCLFYLEFQDFRSCSIALSITGFLDFVHHLGF